MSKQKVRFHRNDRRPGHLGEQLSYEKKMVKKKGDIYWQAVEQPTGTIVRQSFFEEDISQLVDFLMLMLLKVCLSTVLMT